MQALYLVQMCLKTTSMKEREGGKRGEERDGRERGIEEAIKGGRRQWENIKTSKGRRGKEKRWRPSPQSPIRPLYV